MAALGSKPSGGYFLEISMIVRTKDSVEVTVRIGSLAPGAAPGGGPTSPFVFVRMRKLDRPVTCREEEKK